MKSSFITDLAVSRWAPFLFLGVGIASLVGGIAIMVRAVEGDDHLVALAFMALGAWNIAVGVMGFIFGAKKRKAREEKEARNGRSA